MLTADQTKQIEALVEEYRAKVAAVLRSAVDSLLLGRPVEKASKPRPVKTERRKTVVPIPPKTERRAKPQPVAAKPAAGARTYPEKPCIRCKAPFTPLGPRGIYCPRCREDAGLVVWNGEMGKQGASLSSH